MIRTSILTVLALLLSVGTGRAQGPETNPSLDLGNANTVIGTSAWPRADPNCIGTTFCPYEDDYAIGYHGQPDTNVIIRSTPPTQADIDRLQAEIDELKKAQKPDFQNMIYGMVALPAKPAPDGGGIIGRDVGCGQRFPDSCIPTSPQRAYTLDEIDRMRDALEKKMAYAPDDPQRGCYGDCESVWRAQDEAIARAVERELRTDMQFGISPEALEHKAQETK